jgi:hypothetical protein
MMQVTRAAFQAVANLNKQATDPKRHTLVKNSLLEIPLRRYLQIPMVDPAICYADQPAPGEPLENLVCLWCSLDFPQHFLGQRQMIA